MKREIKFRSWMPENKTFAMFRLNQDSKHDLKFDLSIFPVVEGTVLNPEYSEVQQFIGLLDRNSKEIYEGDIVRWGMDGLEHEIRLAVVKIDPDIQFVRFNKPTSIKEQEAWEYIYHLGCFVYSDEIDKVMEVIGNIYEHPDLLK